MGYDLENPETKVTAEPENSTPSFAAEVKKRWREILALGTVAFLVMFSYGITRPAVESLFLESYTAKGLPKAWLFGTFAMLGSVWLYARFVRRLGVGKLCGLVAFIAALSLTLLLLLLRLNVPHTTFLLYIWKEVYIIVLVEAFWSIANLNFSIQTARKIYGFFCALGSLGGISGALSLTPLTSQIGTANSLWLAVPCLGLLSIRCFTFPATLSRSGTVAVKVLPSIHEVIKVLRQSRYLVMLLALVGTTQVVITLIDYQYNTAIAQAYPNVDARTPIMGYVAAAIDACSLFFQVLTSLVFRFIGVEITLALIPLLIALSVLAFWLNPAVLSMAVMKVLGKALDYSFFRASKEILYIPLSVAEKTEGKAVVDMLTYRLAKAITSPLLSLLAKTALVPITAVVFFLLLVWIFLATQVAHRYRQAVAQKITVNSAKDSEP